MLVIMMGGNIWQEIDVAKLKARKQEYMAFFNKAIKSMLMAPRFCGEIGIMRFE